MKAKKKSSLSSSVKKRKIQKQIKERLKKYVDREKKEDDDNKA